MTRSEAKDAMYALLLAAWTGAGQDAARMQWPGFNDHVPDGDTPWARASCKHYEAPTLGFGDGQARVENTGTLFLQVFTPSGNGEAAADNIAEKIVVAIRAARLDVWFRNVRAKEVGTSGAFEQTNVITDFSYV